ncbi:MAG: YicC family protein [Bacteroidetes bacterium]|nr:YicC family protein [Bacteroidota bacterium]MDA1383203.1 YicC family protein [Bacteroidota bacterium]
MIRSMTGYGKAEGVIGNRKYSAEVRSLNSKQFDLNMRMPSVFREKEMGLRKLLRENVIRGKCDFFLSYEQDPAEAKHEINTKLVQTYISQLEALAESSGLKGENLLGMAIRMPDALQSPQEQLDDEVWSGVEKLIINALDAFNTFRETEGAATLEDFNNRIKIIRNESMNLDPLLDERLARIKSRIKTNLSEAIDRSKIDENRFEQEVIFYIEKTDVSEERTRLTAHCNHFDEILADGIGQGKKLGFIAQEIGREINTLGSKANDADIQRLVVQMKDELEKIKEQVLNVL